MTESRQCTRCEQHKLPTEFYSNDRYHCIECERSSASSRMNRYNKTLRGRASQALQNSRKTIKRNGYDILDDLTLMDVIFTFAHSDGECAYCGKVTDNYHLEHIVPLSANGPNTFSNVVTSCGGCNSSKGNQDLLKWREFNEVAAVIDGIASRRGCTIAEVLEEFK
jgi:5-methylcytosine-specific restriction endonuclease McrA